MIHRLATTRASFAVILIRLMVGSVFLSEGIQKVLFPGDPDRGAARFAKLGYSAPDWVSSFVASVEIGCGILILLGLATRLAVLPTIAIMIVAITTTKIPLFESKGFWDMAHAARTDWCMLLGSVYLLMVGAGRWSIDAALSRLLGSSSVSRGGRTT